MSTPPPQEPSSDPEKTSDENNSTDNSLVEKLADIAQVPALKAIEATKKLFHVRGIRAWTPLRSFNPTAVRMRISLHNNNSGSSSSSSDEPDNPDTSDDFSDVAILWRARDNRKGRQSLAISRHGSLPSHHPQTDSRTRRPGPPLPSSSAGRVLLGITRMFTRFPYWDMAYQVAVWFTLGSAIWVANGFMSWLPVAFPGSEAPGEVEYGVGLTSFFGVLAFQVGSTLAYLEAVNEGCWHGSVMRRVIDGCEGVDDKALLDAKVGEIVGRLKPLRRKRSSESEEGVNVEKEMAEMDVDLSWERAIERPRSRHGSVFERRRGAIDMGVDAEEGTVHELLPFRWWPTWKNLREHHAYEVGFLAVTTQLIGATIFIITGVVALPGILDSLSQWLENVVYWIPQMIASVGFILGSAFFMLETQEKWWKPEPKVLGWWVGAWALAGSIGFELCAALSPASYHNNGIAYQSNLASLWGSICFPVSAVLQWYEAVNKNPIEELLDEPGEIKTWQVHPL